MLFFLYKLRRIPQYALTQNIWHDIIIFKVRDNAFFISNSGTSNKKVYVDIHVTAYGVYNF